MNKIIKRVIAMFGASVLTLTLLAPVTEVSAASKNKAAEIPVNFTNSSWEDDWVSCSLTNVNLWGFGESSYSDSYTVSFKLYIPSSFIKKESTINLGGCLNFDDATAEKYIGFSEIPPAEMHSDISKLTAWNVEQETDVPINYATATKAGDFYVISYKAPTGPLKFEDEQSNPTVPEKVYVSFCLDIKGINITAKNSAVYLDDLAITKADGTVIANKNFTSDTKVEGDIHIAPVHNWDNEGKPIKVATIVDNKVLTVKSTKATVKVGKKVKISATATPATKITYTSSNKKVATVNSKGQITGKKAGKATISVKANGKTMKVKVTVKKK